MKNSGRMRKASRSSLSPGVNIYLANGISSRGRYIKRCLQTAATLFSYYQHRFYVFIALFFSHSLIFLTCRIRFWRVPSSTHSVNFVLGIIAKLSTSQYVFGLSIGAFPDWISQSVLVVLVQLFRTRSSVAVGLLLYSTRSWSMKEWNGGRNVGN